MRFPAKSGGWEAMLHDMKRSGFDSRPYEGIDQYLRAIPGLPIRQA